ncbi:FAD-binding domain-containing protein [Xylariomycetidae sp. FL2044]|nr:FAD-binding domain-containing protein [Xylariomycetidae sp. FL2044]
MLWILLAGFALLARGVLPASTTTTLPVDSPILGLARRGIKSRQLDELYITGGDDVDDEEGHGHGHGQKSCHCSLACTTLLDTFGPDQVSLSGEAAYAARRSTYWSAQQSLETRPACFFHPVDADEVAVAVLLARATQCPFAARGAGHAAFRGASSSDGGVTIDFVRMDRVVLSPDRQTVDIGPGNTWLRVYTVLERDNVTMVGGRVASVGVGGLLLGGGISFFSNQHGWACDNVVNYELVTASGEILDVDAVTHPDLYWALRGGGGNFGVVTRFTSRVFPQGLMWGGDRVWELHSSRARLLDALVAFGGHEGESAAAAASDPKAALITSIAYHQAYDIWIASISMTHADPQPPGAHPAVFDRYFSDDLDSDSDSDSERANDDDDDDDDGAEDNKEAAAPPPPPSLLSDGTRTTSLANLTIDLDVHSPFGFRYSYWTVTTQLDRALAAELSDIFVAAVEPLRNLTAPFVPSVSFQVITVPQMRGMRRGGGNALGVVAESNENKPLLITNISFMWVLASEAEAVMTALRDMVAAMEAAARARGLLHPFRYMGYASQFQDPIAGYGAANVARLRAVARQYDPEGVFQRLHPGYFKLRGGAPAVWEEER